MKKQIFMLGCAAGMLAGLCAAPLLQGMLRRTATVANAEDYAGPCTYTVSGDSVCITGCDTAVTGKVEIPEKIDGLPVTEIAEDAFRGCEKLESLYIPDSVETLGGNVFWECFSLKEIRLPQNLKEIPHHAFVYCTSLSTVQIPEHVAYIGESAFGCCSGLKTLVFPESVEEIGEFVLYGCSSLESITVLNPACKLNLLAFYYDGLTVYGYSGSTAEPYAAQNYHIFRALAPAGSVFCDADGNGVIDVCDAQCVLQYYTEALTGKQPSWQKIIAEKNTP